MSKIRVAKIIKDHLDTLKNYESGKPRPLDFITFFVVPLILAALLIYFCTLLNKDIVNILITSLSVFAALLFNLLVLIYGIIQQVEQRQSTSKIETVLLNEIYANISFSVLLSVISICALLLYFLASDKQWLLATLSFVSYFLVLTFVLTLLMILGRVHLLLSKKFKATSADSS